MIKRVTSLLLTLLLVISCLPISVFAVVMPEIYKDEITVRVGNTAKVDFTYGDSATKAEVVISNTGIDAYIVNDILYVSALMEGLSYVTLNFNDGTSDNVRINVVNKYSSVDNDNNIEIIKGKTKNIYIDLDMFDATRATVTYDSDYVTLNKSSFTDSGTLKIAGKNYGDSILKIKYNSGDTEIYNIEIVNEENKDNEEDFYVIVDDSFNYYIDLEYFDADKATITYNSSYVSLNKTNFTYSGYLTITAKKEGSSVIKVKYDTGDVEYLNITAYDDYYDSHESYISVDEIEVEKGQSEYFYIYLGDKADKATLTLNNSYVSLSSSTVYSDGRVKVTGHTVGETQLKVSFDDGTRIYIPVIVTEENYLAGTAEVEKSELIKGDTTTLELFMGTKNSYASITVDNPTAIELDIANYSKNRKNYTVNSAKNKTVTITVTAKELIEETYLTVKYPEGKTYKIALSVVELEKVEGKDKSGNNFILNEGITVNQSVLDTGYIAGYTDGTFGPLKNITREEFGVILARILDYKGVVDSTDYIYDVTAEWSKNSIAELAAMGVVDKNIAYRPKDYITRYEVAEMLYNVVDLNKYSTSCPLTDLDNYSVIGRKIAKCWNAGLIAGYGDGTFGGSRNITRAEAVVLVNRIFYENMNTNKVNVFPDVPYEYWAYPYIVKASKQ